MGKFYKQLLSVCSVLPQKRRMRILAIAKLFSLHANAKKVLNLLGSYNGIAIAELKKSTSTSMEL